jgi:cell division protein ZapA
MSESTTTVSVKILDKEYQVSCPAEEVDALTASARFLDQKMRQIQEGGKVFGLDRIAVMAALNIANDFLTSNNASSGARETVNTRLEDLSERIGQALTEAKQLNL